MSDFIIENRTIYELIPLVDFVVRGDSNSRILKFKIKRYFDNIDLSTKDIKINFINASNKSGQSIGILDELNENEFSFIWIISSEITVKNGKVQYAVQFSSFDDNYLWHTKPNSFLVEDSLIILNDATPTDYTVQKIFYDENNNETVYSYIQDTDPIIKIENKVILIGDQKDIVVSTDTNSQILSFKISRYYQGVDLSTKLICINFINAKKESGMSSAVNVNIYDSDIEFCWLLDSRVSSSAGKVMFSISFIGYDENDEWYSLSTKASTLNVEQGI